MIEYQTFTMHNFDADGDPLLVNIDYLTEMFELEVQNEKGKPIVITLREKTEHLNANH